MDELLEKVLLQRELLDEARELGSEGSLIDFISNDTLGLARSGRLLEAYNASSRVQEGRTGLGSTGSQLLSGSCSYARELEGRIASFHGFESGQIFSSGYMANLGLIASLGAIEGATFIYDIEVHASMHDGMRLARASSYPFRHNDLAHLEKRLRNLSGRPIFILVESIYSMSGSFSPLKEIADLARRYGASLIVDEAHSVGLFGKEGRGVVFQNGLSKQVFALTVTFGKALGVHGAIVLGNGCLKRWLVNHARTLIYSTALPLKNLIAIGCSYDIFPLLEKEREQVQKLASICNSGGSPIASMGVKSSASARELSRFLRKSGFELPAIVAPTVKRGDERLRCLLHAFNTVDQLKSLLAHVERWRQLCERS